MQSWPWALASFVLENNKNVAVAHYATGRTDVSAGSGFTSWHCFAAYCNGLNKRGGSRVDYVILRISMVIITVGGKTSEKPRPNMPIL